MTGSEAYTIEAEKSLKSFSSVLENPDIHYGYYLCAMDAYFHMVKLALQVSPAGSLAEAALSSFSPYLSIVYGEDKGMVIPCVRDVCYEPIKDPKGLKDFLKNRRRAFQ